MKYNLVTIIWLSIAFVVIIFGPFIAHNCLCFLSPLSFLPFSHSNQATSSINWKTFVKIANTLPGCYILGQLLAPSLLTHWKTFDTTLLWFQDIILSWLLLYHFFSVFVSLFCFVLLDPSCPRVLYMCGTNFRCLFFLDNLIQAHEIK